VQNTQHKMSFSWDAYIVIADELKQIGDNLLANHNSDHAEAAFRSSISRSYYALFRLSRDYLEKRSIYLPSHSGAGMTDELKSCPCCGAVNTDDEEVLVIQFATQVDNSTLKREGTIFFIRCLNCGHIGPLVLCPNGLSKKKIFAAWNSRYDALSTVDNITLMAESVRRGLATVESDRLPQWAIDVINHMIDTCNIKNEDYALGYLAALDDVLYLRKPEDKE